jgi:hypothetical protein
MISAEFFFLGLAVAIALATSPAFASGDAKKGKKI